MCMSSGHEGHESSETPSEILQKRLAKGEITLEQYREMKSVLEEDRGSTADQEHHH